MKGRAVSMKFLENKEFLQNKNARLGELLNQIDCPQQDFGETNTQHVDPPKVQPVDSLTLLISKARQATNKKLSKSHKKVKKAVQANQKGPFLTGVDAILQQEDKNQKVEEIQTKDMLDEQIMNLLKKKSLEDDLLLLRKQIKATKGTLQSYQKQVLQSKKTVNRLAGRYNSYFNLNIPVNKATVDFSGYTLGMKSLKGIFHQKQQRNQ